MVMELILNDYLRISEIDQDLEISIEIHDPEEAWQCFRITKEQAIQIIKHLQNEFDIRDRKE